MQGNSWRTAEFGFRLLLDMRTWLPSLKVSIISVDSGDTEFWMGFCSVVSLGLASSSMWMSGAPSQTSRFVSFASVKRTDRRLVPSSSEVTLESVFWKKIVIREVVRFHLSFWGAQKCRICSIESVESI